MADETLPCPYVGLRPFRESDYPFFFGRDRDIRIVASNLQAQPLTVLYGASGVGKSSVLQAGVLPYLRAAPGQSAVYFNEWQSETFLRELSERCRAAVPAVRDEDGRLDDALGQGGQFFLLLDQFEEYLLYHGADAGLEFDAMLARIVNREDVSVRVLIGIREDALSRLDQRFGIRIPNLLGNTLMVEHLDASAAREAIRRPLAVFNERYPESGGYRIESELVEEILQQVQAGQVTRSESAGLGSAAGRAGANCIETAFLQLVLTRLWLEETRTGSRTLRLEMLSKIGGAGSIVQKHVDDVMAGFVSVRHRDIAACIFRYLVTPSRTKVAQSTGDLILFGEAPGAEVRDVLATLTDRSETRILRRIANPERYEIFHDVLAQPILDWRRAYLERKERAVNEERQAVEVEQQRRELEQARALAMTERRRAEEQARSARRLRWMLAAVMITLLLAVSAAIYAFRERRDAKAYAKQAEQERIDAATNKSLQLTALSQAEAAKSQLLGKTAEAESLRAQAQQFSNEALRLALSSPSGLAFDSAGHLWLANSGVNSVLEVDADNGLLLRGIANGVNGPTNVAFDSQGHLFVSNTKGNSVTEYDSSNGKLRSTISRAYIQKPLGIAVDSKGDIYVTNQAFDNIVVLKSSGDLLTTVNKDRTGFSAPGPLAIHQDVDGREYLYIGFGPIPGKNAVVSYEVTSFLQDDKPVERTIYTDNVNTGPTGIAFDAAGNVYVSDLYSGTWVKYNSTGTLLSKAQLGNAAGIAWQASTGRIYATNSKVNNIFVFTTGGAAVKSLF